MRILRCIRRSWSIGVGNEVCVREIKGLSFDDRRSGFASPRTTAASFVGHSHSPFAVEFVRYLRRRTTRSTNMTECPKNMAICATNMTKCPMNMTKCPCCCCRNSPTAEIPIRVHDVSVYGVLYRQGILTSSQIVLAKPRP